MSLAKFLEDHAKRRSRFFRAKRKLLNQGLDPARVYRASPRPLSPEEAQFVAQRWPFRRLLVISIREQRFVACLKRLGPGLASLVQPLACCDGRTLPQQPGTTQTRGVQGCFESHRRAWVNAAGATEPTLILEDDVALWPCARVLKRLQAAAETIQQKREPWDILCLGRSKKKRYENKMRIGPGVVKPADFWGLFAYVITPTGARKLLSFVPEYQGRLPVDVMVSRLGNRGKVQILALKPCAVGQVPATSDTNGVR